MSARIGLVIFGGESPGESATLLQTALFYAREGDAEQAGIHLAAALQVGTVTIAYTGPAS